MKMVGPSGPDGCCRFSCLEPATVVLYVRVNHPGRSYVNEYPFCTPHMHVFNENLHYYAKTVEKAVVK